MLKSLKFAVRGPNGSTTRGTRRGARANVSKRHDRGPVERSAEPREERDNGGAGEEPGVAERSRSTQAENRGPALQVVRRLF